MDIQSSEFRTSSATARALHLVELNIYGSLVEELEATCRTDGE